MEKKRSEVIPQFRKGMKSDINETESEVTETMERYWDIYVESGYDPLNTERESNTACHGKLFRGKLCDFDTARPGTWL